jgi:hypothetical protein
VLPNGTVSAPGFGFASDTGIGFYRGGAGQLWLTASQINSRFLGAVMEMTGQGQIRFNSAGTDFSGSADLYLGRRAAATLNLGAADAATPVAQNVSVQSVVAGTTNTAGANFTIKGSQGTGTGLGGAIALQTAPASTTGSTPNALRTVLALDGNAHANFGGTAPTPGGSCGTSPTMTSGSTDSAGQLNVGTGSPTSCTVTFATAFAAAPFCVVSALTTANMSAYTVSTSAITITTTTASAKVNYVCHGA